MAENYATSIAPKPAVAIREQSKPEAWFEPSVPDFPAGLTVPVYPGWGAGTYTLNSFERGQVDRYIANPADAVLATLTLPAAIAKANEFKTMFADPKYKAWFATKQLARIGQWKLAVGSAVIGNIDAVPESMDNTGAGTPPPDEVLPSGANVP
jgi:hypothetical protein